MDGGYTSWVGRDAWAEDTHDFFTEANVFGPSLPAADQLFYRCEARHRGRLRSRGADMIWW